eukprot:998969_1
MSAYSGNALGYGANNTTGVTQPLVDSYVGKSTQPLVHTYTGGPSQPVYPYSTNVTGQGSSGVTQPLVASYIGKHTQQSVYTHTDELTQPMVSMYVEGTALPMSSYGKKVARKGHNYVTRAAQPLVTAYIGKSFQPQEATHTGQDIAQPLMSTYVGCPTQPLISTSVGCPTQPLMSTSVGCPTQPLMSTSVGCPSQPLMPTYVGCPTQPLVSTYVGCPTQPTTEFGTPIDNQVAHVLQVQKPKKNAKKTVPGEHEDELAKVNQELERVEKIELQLAETVYSLSILLIRETDDFLSDFYLTMQYYMIIALTAGTEFIFTDWILNHNGPAGLVIYPGNCVDHRFGFWLTEVFLALMTMSSIASGLAMFMSLWKRWSSIEKSRRSIWINIKSVMAIVVILVKISLIPYLFYAASFYLAAQQMAVNIAINVLAVAFVDYVDQNMFDVTKNMNVEVQQNHWKLDFQTEHTLSWILWFLQDTGMVVGWALLWGWVAQYYGCEHILGGIY